MNLINAFKLNLVFKDFGESRITCGKNFDGLPVIHNEQTGTTTHLFDGRESDFSEENFLYMGPIGDKIYVDPGYGCGDPYCVERSQWSLEV